MPLDIPNLDDRRWADLVEDARALIPRFAPQWTDHNAHDPGITFTELFAWLAEMQMYQVNRVGERHREAFARLAGVRRRAATPAHVDLRVNGTPSTSVIVPAGTQITPVEADDLVFETTEPVQLTRSLLQRVVIDDGTSLVDQTDANSKAGIAFLAFGERARPNASLRIGFDRFYPDEEARLRLSFDVFTEDLNAPCEREGNRQLVDTDAARSAPVQIAWEYRDAGDQWLPLTVDADQTYAFLQSGAVIVRTPRPASPNGAWMRARIVGGQYDIEPRLRQISVNVLPCVQRETVSDERLGVGDSRPDQAFAIAKGSVSSPFAVKVLVENVEWQAVESFDGSDPRSRHFIFDSDQNQILVGNGLNGRVPQAGERIVAFYETSRGESGNVAKGLRWRFRTLVVPGVSLANPNPGAGGASRQSTNDLELEAQAVVARADRGVTLRDLEQLARATRHVRVGRAKAIPNCPSPESITVVAVPKARPGRTGPPARPSDAFLAAVRTHLQGHRLLCDDLRVVGPIYLEVSVSARLRLSKGAGAAMVVERARKALQQFLAGNLQPGDRRTAVDGIERDAPDASPCPTRWPFGRAVFPSEVYAVLDSVVGVEFAADVVLRATRDGTPIAATSGGSIPVPVTGLVFSGTHDLTADGGRGSTR
jgi:hypothetical protein